MEQRRGATDRAIVISLTNGNTVCNGVGSDSALLRKDCVCRARNSHDRLVLSLRCLRSTGDLRSFHRGKW